MALLAFDLRTTATLAWSKLRNAVASLGKTSGAAALPEEDWAKILQSTRSHKSLLKHPRMLKLRLTAARATFNDAVMVEVADLAVQAKLVPSMRTRIAMDLAATRKHLDAWRVISADPSCFELPNFLRTGRVILSGIKDPKIRREISAVLDRLTKDGGSVRAKPSAFQFGRSDALSPPRGTVELVGSPAVDPRHVARFQAEYERFVEDIQTLAPPRIEEYENLFTDRYGQKWTQSGGIVETVGRPIPVPPTEDVPHVEVGIDLLRGTKGFYHWYVDVLPKLAWLLNTDIARPKILMSGHAPKFEMQTLELLGFGESDVVRVTESAFVERLVCPRIGFDGLADWALASRLYDTVVDSAKRQSKVKLAEKIYISRRDAAGRKMVNELELERRLAAKGFHICILSELSVADQIALTHGAKVIVAPHGAGLSHIMHARPATTIVEILPIRDGSYRLRFNYARLCVVRGLRYFGWVEPQSYTVAEWAIAVEPFMAHLDRVLAKVS
ncbi:glycosyltransferase family 61 protein [Rhizobium sp. YIM 134829]|uniref:glycosyltransferase family 61 protein n=1 Tax=Rhizobium sp. YIM 134829 TaxID=3390453 RepID=UPI00397884A4